MVQETTGQRPICNILECVILVIVIMVVSVYQVFFTKIVSISKERTWLELMLGAIIAISLFMSIVLLT